MRAIFLGLVAMAILGDGCAGSKPAQVPSSEPATSAMPPNAKEVSCVEMVGCYDSAKGMCNGAWHHVARRGEPFPYASQEPDKRLHMLVECGEAK